MKHKNHPFAIFTSCAICLAASHVAQAAAISYKAAGGNGNWNDTASWEGGAVPGTVPGDADTVSIGGGVAYNNSVIDLVAFSPDINKITITSRNSTFSQKTTTINATGVGILNIGSGGINMPNGGNVADSIVFNASINLTSDQPWTGVGTNGGGTHFLGLISGAYKITFSGSRSTRFTNVNNSFSGGLQVDSGTVLLPNNSLPALTTGPLGIGTLTLNGGTLTTAGGTARVLHNNVILGGDVTLGGVGNAYGSTGDISFAPATIPTTFLISGSGANRTLTVSNNTTISQGVGETGGTGNGLTKAGSATLTISSTLSNTGSVGASGGTLVLSGTNTSYAGKFHASGTGTTRFTKTAVLYGGATGSWTAANMTAASGGALAFNVGGTGEFTAANVTTLLTNLGGLGGAVAIGEGLQAGSYFGLDTNNVGSTFTLTDTLSNSTGDGGGAIGLRKLGAKTLVLTAANSYTGGTIVSAGTLLLSGSGTMGASTGPLTIEAGGVDLAGSSQAVGAVTISGAGSIFNGSLTGTSYAATLGTGTATVSANLLGGASLPLTKSGGGSLTLSGTNTYGGGTSITRGTVTVSNSSALGTGNVSINSGGANGNEAQINLADGVILPVGMAISLGANYGTSARNLIGVATGHTATVNGPISVTGAITYGGHIGGSSGGSTGTLILNGVITSPVTLNQRNGTVVYGGGGTGYSALAVNEGTARVGAANGISTSASVTGSVSVSATLDLAGFNQQLVGLVRNHATNTFTIGNSSTASDSTLTLTGSNDASGNKSTFVIQDVVGSGTKKTALVVNGTGNTITLGGVNTYTGTTTIKAGTLALASTGSIADSAVVTVGDTGSSGTVLNLTAKTTATLQTLAGIGTVQLGAATLSLGGLAPGSGVGSLTVTSTAGVLALGTSSALHYDLDGDITTVGAGVNDHAAITGDLTLDGTLHVTEAIAGTFALAASAGDSYQLMSYTGTLTDNGLDLGTMPTLPSGLEFAVKTDIPGLVNLVVQPVGGGNPYQDWIDQGSYNTPPLTEAEKHPNADPDKDGICNLLEFSLEDGNPVLSAQDILPKQSVDASNIILTFKRSDGSESTTTQTVEISENLEDWTSITPITIGASSSLPVVSVDQKTGYDDVIVTIPRGGAMKKFVRLKILKTP